MSPYRPAEAAGYFHFIFNFTAGFSIAHRIQAISNLLVPRQRSPTTDKDKDIGRNSINLTPEILPMITEHLSPVDEASLILCNHVLLWALGSRRWSLLRAGEDNETYRELFRTILTPDLPGHFFCHCCSCLHLRDNVDPPGPALQHKNRLFCIGKHAREDRSLAMHSSAPVIISPPIRLPPSAAGYEEAPLRAWTWHHY